MLQWFANPENTKPLGLVIFFVGFCVVLYWAFGSKRRGEQLEEHRNIPFLDEEDESKDQSHG